MPHKTGRCNLNLTYNAELKPYNSFGVSAKATCLAEIHASEDLEQAVELADSNDLPLLLLGGGTNVLFAGDFPGMVLLMRNRGVEIDRESGLIRIAAGENWHDLVQTCLKNSLYGLENMALIPGSTGAAPVQNIGAYGIELESFFVELDLFDCNSGNVRTMNRKDCNFSYRDSILKQPRPRPQVVCSLTLQLLRDPTPNLSYPTLAKELEPIGDPTPQDIFKAVCQIRRRRLPDPTKIGNDGSFFKNPVIPHNEFEQLRTRFDSPPSFPAKEGIKIPAGWLLEQCGFKGYTKGEAGVSERHALVLINRGGATGKELHQLAMEMQARVQSEFGITLEPEVRVICTA
ncbi:MAG: UDP-N-acetylmuramate dehydrogenase [Gammaproteobacteria bacterium]|nr:UDP-N-acetylmuramate dehydrogenase [Gammaproteobacteria bacterium]